MRLCSQIQGLSCQSCFYTLFCLYFSSRKMSALICVFVLLLLLSRNFNASCILLLYSSSFFDSGECLKLRLTKYLKCRTTKEKRGVLCFSLYSLCVADFIGGVGNIKYGVVHCIAHFLLKNTATFKFWYLQAQRYRHTLFALFSPCILCMFARACAYTVLVWHFPRIFLRVPKVSLHHTKFSIPVYSCSVASINCGHRARLQRNQNWRKRNGMSERVNEWKR